MVSVFSVYLKAKYAAEFEGNEEILEVSKCKWGYGRAIVESRGNHLKINTHVNLVMKAVCKVLFLNESV